MRSKRLALRICVIRESETFSSFTITDRPLVWAMERRSVVNNIIRTIHFIIAILVAYYSHFTDIPVCAFLNCVSASTLQAVVLAVISLAVLRAVQVRHSLFLLVHPFAMQTRAIMITRKVTVDWINLLIRIVWWLIIIGWWSLLLELRVKKMMLQNYSVQQVHTIPEWLGFANS